MRQFFQRLPPPPTPTVLVISEDIISLYTLSTRLTKSSTHRFNVIELSDPVYAVNVVARKNPDVVVTDAWYGRMRQECWPVVAAITRRWPSLQFVVIDHEDKSDKVMMTVGTAVIPWDSARFGETLARNVYFLAQQAQALSQPRRKSLRISL